MTQPKVYNVHLNTQSLELPLHPPYISTITPTYYKHLGFNYTFLIILMMSHDTNDAPTLEPTISYICR